MESKNTYGILEFPFNVLLSFRKKNVKQGWLIESSESNQATLKLLFTRQEKKKVLD